MSLYFKLYQRSGHIRQGRFKAFSIQNDEHPATVVRYVERNTLRANLVARAEYSPWSRLRTSADTPALDTETLVRTDHWLHVVNAPMTEAEVEAIQLTIHPDRSFGTVA